MSIVLAQNLTHREYTWTALKAANVLKVQSVQYDDDGTVYAIYFYDGPEVNVAMIWKGTVPQAVIDGGYSQAQNDADKTDFETYYKPYFNQQIAKGGLDPRLIHRFGNLTSTSTSEVLMSARAYVEQGSEAQRSIQSTSATDDDGSATGARQVRITYLTSAYVLKTEDLFTNGTAKVDTIATDIRFIQKFEVIKGTAAVGAIQLMTGTTGGASEFCGIPAGTERAFLCHHYVPAGRRAYVLGWGATVDNNANFKLKGQQFFGANLVDQNLDLENMMRATATIPSAIMEFYRKFTSPPCIGEKCYIRVTTVPGQVASTIQRSLLDVWEDVV
jgi:hypothetical protein